MSEGHWEIEHSKRGWTPRTLLRAAAGIAVTALLGALLLALFGPFWHPRTHLLVLTGAQQRVDGWPTIEYAAEDAAALASLEPALHFRDGRRDLLTLDQLRARDEMPALADSLHSVSGADRDVVLLYVAAHGVTDRGVAYLMCGDAAADDPTAGRYPLRNLLRQLKSTVAGVKLLLLDASHVDHDAQRGIVSGDFARLVADEVQRNADPRLWVLTSCSAAERSHTSPALQRSVFGYFVTEGLAGAADLDGDDRLAIGELYRYVAVNTNAWVRGNTAGAAMQTPRLLHAGDRNAAPDRASAVLLSLAALREHRGASNHVLAIRTAQAQQAELPTAIGDYQLKSGDQLISEATRDIIPRSGVARQVFNAAARVLPVPGISAPLPGLGEPAEGEAPEEPAAARTPPAPRLPADDGLERGSEEELTPAELLAEAWQWRDVLEQVSPETARPLDYAPHLWRWLEVRLLSHERRLRAGIPGDEADVQELRNLVRSLRALAADRTTGATPTSFAGRLARFAPRLDVQAEHLGSLALAELIAVRGGPLLSPAAADAADALDRLLADDAAGPDDAAGLDEFRNWARQLGPELDRYRELRLARQLAAVEGVNWPTLRLALGTRREAERLAAGAVWCTSWVRPSVDNAERRLHVGERELLDWSQTGDLSLARELLESAAADFRQARALLDAALETERLANDLLHRAPSYLRWFALAGEAAQAGDRAPRYDDLVQLLDDLRAATQILDAGGSGDAAGLQPRLNRLVELRERLIELQSRLDAPLRGRPIDELAFRPYQSGDLWTIEMLLGTPLMAASDRVRLLEAVGAIDVDVASRLRLPSAASAELPSHLLVADDWRRIAASAALHLRLARIADSDAANNDLLAALERTYAELQAVVDAADDAQWKALSTFSAALAEFYRGLAGSIEGETSRSAGLAHAADRQQRLARLRAARRRMFLLDGRDADRIESSGPARVVEQADLYDLLLWHRRRALAAEADSPPPESGWFAANAAAYTKAAAALPNQPRLTDAAPARLNITGPDSITLTLEPERQLEFAVQQYGQSQAEVRLLLEYDPAALRVSTESDGPAFVRDHGQPTVRQGAAPSNQTAPSNQQATRADLPTTVAERARAYAAQPDLSARQATMSLRGGETGSLRVRISSAPGADRPTRLVVRAISGAAQTRHDVVIFPALPKAARLAVEGLPGTVSPTDAGLVLHPYPNQGTEFAFQLRNETSTATQVDVELLSLAAPPQRSVRPVVLTPAERETFFRELGKTTRLALLPAVAAPPGETVPLAFPKVAPAAEANPPNANENLTTETPPATAPAATSAAEPPPTTTSSPATASAESNNGAPSAAKPLLTAAQIPHLLLAVLTDRASGRSTIEPIHFRPQHPARYVRPRVDYDAAAGRINVTVRPIDSAFVPPGGIRISGDVLGPLPETAEILLDGSLTSAKPVLPLHVDAPAGADRQLLLQLHVDDYPRAFVYRVACEESAVDIQPANDLVDLRITSPAPQTALLAPRETVPVELQVDVPSGALDVAANSVAVGIDADRDRELVGESPLTLPGDRQVTVGLSAASPAGAIVFDARIGDFRLELPAPGLRNARVNVIARALVGDRIAWSPPVEIVLDGAPPRVLSVGTTPPGEIASGQILEVRVKASDDALSGIERVEVGFDKDRVGRISGAPETAKLQPDGSWLATVSTGDLAVGPVNVLARAVDKVGIAGKFARAEIQILSSAAPPPAATQVVRGRVLYGSEAVSAAEVNFTDAEGAALPPTLSDARGNFESLPLPPGKYTVTARALKANKHRTAEAEVEVEPDAQTPPLELQIR